MTADDVHALLAVRARAEEHCRYFTRHTRVRVGLTCVDIAFAVMNAVAWRLTGSLFSAIVVGVCSGAALISWRAAMEMARLRDLGMWLVRQIDQTIIHEGIEE